MNTLTKAYNYRWIIFLAALVLFIPVHPAFAGIGLFIYNIIHTFFGWVVGIGGSVLNLALNDYVIGFGTEFTTSGLGVAVDTTWSTFRDFFNLTFIFGLVYIGFKMILGSDDGNTRRWLINLILAALLVNFSLFITKFVVDFSNILAVEIINIGVADNGLFVQDGNDIDMSGSMMNLMNIKTTIEANAGEGLATGTDISWTTIFGSMFLYLVTAFVYFSAGIMLIIRAAVLLILMIVSPFLFLGMVLPMFASFSRDLWSKLFKRAFLAPMYIGLLYIAMKLARELVGTGSFGRAFVNGSSATAEADAATAFGPFIIIIILLLGSLSAAQKMGAEGAGAMMKLGKNLRQRGQQAVGGRVARTVARGAERTGRGYNRATNYAASTRAAKYLNTTKSGKVIKGVGKAAAFVGTAGLVGGVVNDKNIRGTLKAAEGASISGSETLAQERSRVKGVQTELKNQARQDEQKKMIENGLATLDLSNTEATFDELEKAARDLSDSFGKMSTPELNEQETSRLTDPNVALSLRDSQISGLEKSGTKSPAEIQEIKDARKAAQISVAERGFANKDANISTYKNLSGDEQNTFQENQRRNLFQGSVADVGKLPPDVYANEKVVNHLKPQFVNERFKNGVSKTEREAMEANLQNAIIDPDTGEQNEQMATTWKRWSENSDYSTEMNLKFKEGNKVSSAVPKPPSQTPPQTNQPTTSEGGIVLGTSQADLRDARDYRDSQNQS